MAKWRAAAIQRLPEFRKLIADSDCVMYLWTELILKFEDAYRDPIDEDLIARIYSFADWCMKADRNDDAGHDPPTAVMVGFYEHIPANAASRLDMPRWFAYDDIALNEPIFSYLIGKDSYQELLRYMKKNRLK